MDQGWTRRQVLGASAGAAAAATVGGGRASARGGPVVLVRNGVAASAIVLTSDSPELTAAAQDLVDVVRAASGAELSIVDVPPATGVPIYLGVTPPRHQAPTASEVGRDGFVITVSPEAISIVGLIDSGARMGAYAFCEDFLGARWLFPGPDGLDVPLSRHLSAAVGRWAQRPSFEQRSLSPFHRRAGYDPRDTGDAWALHNRVNWLFDQSHGLWAMVPVQKYGNPELPTYRPDFYPILGGKRFFPAVGGKTSWQPRLTADGILDVAVEEVRATLLANPGVTTHGIGVNDSGRWSDDEVDPARRNALGYPDMSEIYYTFINQLVERLAPEFPDVTFGTIAYQHVTEPPPFRLHPNIVVFLCQERYGWVDENFREFDQDLTLRWLQCTDNLGWYDYFEDSAYQVPRPLSEPALEAYRWASSVGVRHVYAELYPNFTAGPQSFLVPRMLWDLDLDLDAELADWYRRMVGPAAAGPLRAYYRLWEEFWAVTVPQAREWFSTARIYFTFSVPSYLNLVTPAMLEQCRSLVATVVERAAVSRDPAHRDRAEHIRRGFELVEATVLSYPVQRPTVASASAAEAMWQRLKQTQGTALAMADKRRQLINEFAGDVVLKQWNAPLALGLDWTGWMLYEVFAVSDWILRGDVGADALLEELRDERTSSDEATARLATLITDAASPDTSKQIFVISDMEDERYVPVAYLTTMSDQTVGQAGATTDAAASGVRSYRIPAGSLTLLYRTAWIAAGPVRIRLKVRGTAGTKAPFPVGGWQIQLWNTIYHHGTSAVDTRRSVVLPIRELGEDWVDLEWCEMLPDDVYKVLTRAMVITSDDVYIDDYEAWQYG